MALAFTIPSLLQADDNQLIWGENVGPVSAIVIETDSNKGLSVIKKPSEKAPLVNYIKKNERLRGKNVFEKGWMKLEGKPGWVKINFLEPMPYKSRITRINAKKNCVPIHVGPSIKTNRIGCLSIGQVVDFSGLMTEDNWLELNGNKGWVSTNMFNSSELPKGKLVAQKKEQTNVTSGEDVGPKEPKDPVEGTVPSIPPTGDVVVSPPPSDGNNEESHHPPGNGEDENGNGQMQPGNGAAPLRVMDLASLRLQRINQIKALQWFPSQDRAKEAAARRTLETKNHRMIPQEAGWI